MRDIARLFEDISGLGVSVPQSPCAVTIFFKEAPWDLALGWMVRACGWSHRVDGHTIRIESPKS
jgi:hypothetical protein